MSENEKKLPLYDVFPDNYFNWQDWHAPCLEEPDEIRQLLKQCHLESRTIKNIRLVGLDYAHTLEEDAPTPKDAPHPCCGLAEQMDPNQKEERCVEIDEPIIITFAAPMDYRRRGFAQCRRSVDFFTLHRCHHCAHGGVYRCILQSYTARLFCGFAFR